MITIHMALELFLHIIIAPLFLSHFIPLREIAKTNGGSGPMEHAMPVLWWVGLHLGLP